MTNYFSIPMFFVLFRECLEAAIIVSVLIGFIDRISLPSTEKVTLDALKKKLSKMVWFGTLIAMVLTFVISGVVIAIFYIYATNIWERYELLWEGVFCIIASIAITVTAFAMLRTSQLSEKLKVKLEAKLLKTNAEKDGSIIPAEVSDSANSSRFIDYLGYGGGPYKLFFWIPFITVLREGVEALLFVSGVAFTEEFSAIPLAVIAGILAGIAIGFFIHYGGSKLTLHYFYICSSYFMLLMAAGLCSKGVGFFEDYDWSTKSAMDADRPDALFFNPMINVWVLPELSEKGSSIWTILNAVFGWKSIGTYGNITSYCVYWLVVSIALVVVRKRTNNKSMGNAV
ncbi:high-affinity iron permease [Globomyces sp. JEL0801]|nr:high-affinity iron permease [Globomyces sp. JEL0801]